MTSLRLNHPCPSDGREGIPLCHRDPGQPHALPGLPFTLTLKPWLPPHLGCGPAAPAQPPAPSPGRPAVPLPLRRGRHSLGFRRLPPVWKSLWPRRVVFLRQWETQRPQPGSSAGLLAPGGRAPTLASLTLSVNTETPPAPPPFSLDQTGRYRFPRHCPSAPRCHMALTGFLRSSGHVTRRW